MSLKSTLKKARIHYKKYERKMLNRLSRRIRKEEKYESLSKEILGRDIVSSFD
jgi:hypothetical protein